jgi:hypothetical protein
MWVVKLGGSLMGTPALKGWLDALVEFGDGKVVPQDKATLHNPVHHKSGIVIHKALVVTAIDENKR